MLITLAFLAAGSARACERKPFDPIADGRDATLALVGYVVGERRLEFEPRISKGEGPPSLLSHGSRLVQVGVVDVLRGEAGKVIEAPAPCDWKFPELFERVTVVRGVDGYIRVFWEADVESELRAALTAEH